MPRKRDDFVGDLTHDPAVADAIGRMSRRAEEPRENVLAATFVDPGVARQLDNNSDQILLGRRGTGKTHVLKVMQRRFTSRASQLAVYADLTGLGSTEEPVRDGGEERAAAALLVDLLTLIYDECRRRSDLDFALANAEPQIEALAQVIRESAFAKVAGAVSTSSKLVSSRGGQVGATVSATPKAELSGRRERSTEQAETEEWTLQAFDRVEFTAVSKALGDLIEAAKLERLAVLIDEWVEIPFNLQPYLAEFVKRCFRPVPRVTVKVAAIEHRSQFGTPLARNTTRGFDLNADIFTVSALDETYFFWDRNPEQVESRLADLLYRHVAVEAALDAAKRSPGAHLPSVARARPSFIQRLLGRTPPPVVEGDDAVEAVAVALGRDDWPERFMENEGARFMREEIGVTGSADFVEALFGDRAFSELARAAQGVVRDYLVIFYKAFHQARDERRIERSAIREALNAVYTDKLTSLDDEQREHFKRVSKAVLDRRMRSFVADEELNRDHAFQSLVDKRVLHPLNRRYADVSDPGELYGIYTLDYGGYAERIELGELPDSDFTAPPGEGTVAPFSDDRRMRRLLLKADVLTAEPRDNHA
jgi:hypothetical protein